MMIQQNPDEPYYQAIARVTAQNDGMFAAIDELAGDYKITFLDLLILQAAGDLLDIIPAFDEDKRINWDSLHGVERENEFEKMVSCSVLIKAKDDWSDVFVGHTTFTSY